MGAAFVQSGQDEAYFDWAEGVYLTQRASIFVLTLLSRGRKGAVLDYDRGSLREDD